MSLQYARNILIYGLHLNKSSMLTDPEICKEILQNPIRRMIKFTLNTESGHHQVMQARLPYGLIEKLKDTRYCREIKSIAAKQ